MEVHSRAWAWTIPPTNSAALTALRFKLWDHEHYRIQPLPQIRPLVELDALGPSDPGINYEWQRTGQYPRFRSDSPPETAADDFGCVTPSNRIVDPLFEKPLGEAWKLVKGAASQQRGELRAALAATNAEVVIAQKIGTIQPGTDYLLWADMQVESLQTNGTATGQIMLAWGKGLDPIQQAAVESAKGQRRHWRTHSVYYKAGVATNDVAIGQDLYVVFRATGSGLPAGPAPAAVVRWNNVHLFTGEPAPK